jgi:UDP-N-acetylglucosamine:LPS N-acetylglucosamine transferase
MPLKVVFASVHAGGGHNTVRDALVRSVTRLDPHYRRIVPMTWTAANGFDTFYRFCVRLGVQGLVFWLTNFSFSAWLATVLNPRLLLEVLNLLRVQRPDVVVSTHVQLSACFQLARLLLRSRVRLINVIPDYGVPTPAFFPRHRALRADATLVNGEDTFQSLESVAEAHELYRIGTLVSEPFEVLAQSSAIKSKPAVAKEQWKRELAATSPDIARLETNKPIVTFFGGSGFARGCQPVIERLMTHEGLGTQFSIVVLAGRDSQFETELLTRYGGRPGFFVLGFLSHDALSRLYALTDVPVMGSLAHSTLQEMLETRCGPLLIHRVIPGTEPPYVDFVERERLGLYEPEPEAMARLVLESVGVGQASLKLRSLKAEFAKRAVRLRDEHRRLAPKLLGHIERVAGVEPRRLPATGVSDGAAAVGARRSMSLDDIPTSE